MGDLINVMLHLDKINIQLLNSFDFNFLYSILFSLSSITFHYKNCPSLPRENMYKIIKQPEKLIVSCATAIYVLQLVMLNNHRNVDKKFQCLS